MNRRIGRSSWASALLLMFFVIFTTCLTGCGENADHPKAFSPTEAANIQLLVSSPQINSDGATTVTVTANVKNSSNVALKDQAVYFSASSGRLIMPGTETPAAFKVANATADEDTYVLTDKNGNAQAMLSTLGNAANRTITVTASAGEVQDSNTVQVTGTTISISGLSSLPLGGSTDLTIFLKDSAGAGIRGQTMAVSSSKGNSLAAASYRTDNNGQITVTVTATVSGTDTITAAAIGATQTYSMNVTTAILTINPPTPGHEVAINTWQPVTATYTSGGVPVAGATIVFATSRGQLSATSAVTGAAGTASVQVRSPNAGPAEIAVSAVPGPSTRVAIEFIATTPAKIALQPNPATIGPNGGTETAERSLITAVVRDANDNLVKNQTVYFRIVSDVGQGRLSPMQAITDNAGKASTYYIAGGGTTGHNGVTVQAYIVGGPSAQTMLTVARKSLFITLSTGPTVTKVDPNKYQKDYIALVTDADGNPVVGAKITPKVVPLYYQKGYYTFPQQAARWARTVTLVPALSTLPSVPACRNEDTMLSNPLYDFNGVLDTDPVTGNREDQNGNDRLDPGNVASVTATETDSAGCSTVSIVYARDYAYWVHVKLETWTPTEGSTAYAVVTFDLPGAAPDYTSPTTDPPGNPSPFGTSISCFVDLEVMPVSASQMALSWQRSNDATLYRIYRNGINVGNTTQNSYLDTGLAGGTSYCYQIRMVNAAGQESVLTGTVCATTFVSAPTGLTATAISPTQIQLNWTGTAGAAGYNIYRDGDTTPLKSVAATSTLDTNLTAETTYCYAVSSFNSAGESAKSATVCATTRPAGPPVPKDLKATGTAAPLRIIVTWTTSTGAASYRLYRDGALIASPAGSQYNDTAVTAYTHYCYAISAVDALGNESTRSDPVCTSTGTAAPATPTNLLLDNTGAAGTMLLTWNTSVGATSYRIYRNGVFVVQVGAVAQWGDAGLTSSDRYCYTISALDIGGNESTQSTSVCAAAP